MAPRITWRLSPWLSRACANHPYTLTVKHKSYISSWIYPCSSVVAAMLLLLLNYSYSSSPLYRIYNTSYTILAKGIADLCPNDDTQPVIRAIGVSHIGRKDQLRQNLRSYSWSVNNFFRIYYELKRPKRKLKRSNNAQMTLPSRCRGSRPELDSQYNTRG